MEQVATGSTADQTHSAQAGMDRQLLLLIVAVIAGALMTVLDATAVNVALHTVARDLHATLAATQWTLTAYLMMLALVVPVSGWATDRFGAKRLWLVSLALFMAGSLLCGLATSVSELIAFRLLQGLGGGMIAPLAQTILARAAGPARMGRTMSSFGLVTVLGPVVGPVLGGALATEASWRAIFLINLPIGALALVTALRVLPRVPGNARQYLDVRGLALASAGLAALVYGLSQASSSGGFAHPVVYAPMATGAVLLAGFTGFAARRGPTALIGVRLFTDRGFAAANVVLVLIGMALFGSLLILPLYFQQIHGHTALTAGLLLAPQGLGVAAALRLAGRHTDRLGARAVVVPGLLLMLVGTLPYALVADAHTSYAVLIGALLVRGFGMGLVMTPVTAAAFVRLSPPMMARASATTVITRQIGGSVGTALLAVILTSNLTPVSPVHGFHLAFWAAVAITALALIPAAFLARPRSKDT